MKLNPVKQYSGKKLYIISFFHIIGRKEYPIAKNGNSVPINKLIRSTHYWI